MLGRTRRFPDEHDPSSSVLLTACQTLHCRTVPRIPFLRSSTDGPTASARQISSTKPGPGAFHGISPEDAVQISCTAVSMPRARNLWELVDHLQCSLPATQCKHTVQLFRKSSLLSCHRRVVGDARAFHVCFHPLQQPGRRLVELSRVASNSETPPRPGHAVDSTVQVAISTEHLASPNLFHITTSWTCSHHLLSDLSSSNLLVVPQPTFPPSVSDGSPKQATVFPWTNTGSASMWDEMNT